MSTSMCVLSTSTITACHFPSVPWAAPGGATHIQGNPLGSPSSKDKSRLCVIYVNHGILNQVEFEDLYLLLFRNEEFQRQQKAQILTLGWLLGNTPSSIRAENRKLYSTDMDVVISWNTQMSLNAPVIFRDFIHKILTLDLSKLTWENNHFVSW